MEKRSVKTKAVQWLLNRCHAGMLLPTKYDTRALLDAYKAGHKEGVTITNKRIKHGN